MDYASSCSGNCESCRSLADAGNAKITSASAAPLGNFVKKVSKTALVAALEKMEKKYQGAAETPSTPPEGEQHVLTLRNGRQVSIAPDAGLAPSPIKPRDAAIDAELEKLGRNWKQADTAKPPSQEAFDAAQEKLRKKYRGRI